MEEATAKGGVFAVKAFAEECGLWKRVASEPALEARKDRSKGYDPVVYVATFLFGFACGGASMSDFERLNDEDGLKRFLGITKFPDQTTLAEWLRAIGEPGAAALMRINRDFIAWALERIAPARLLHAGSWSCFSITLNWRPARPCLMDTKPTFTPTAVRARAGTSKR